MMIQFPLDSNIRYLPLVYLLPPDLIARCPTLCALPRCLSEIAASDDMMDMITGDAFLKEIMDAVASLAFPHFGFGGWKAIPRCGVCPTLCLSGQSSSRKKQAGACRRFFV